MILIAIRNTCLIGLPLLLILAGWLSHIQPEVASYQSILTISLTANIGYFTNYIAIKMLFNPYEKTVMGRQGVIPKNQASLSQSLAETMTENFFDERHWRAYIQNSQLLEWLMVEIETKLIQWLNQQSNQQQLVNFVEKIVVENREYIDQLGNELSQKVIAKGLNNIDTRQVADSMFEWIEKWRRDNPLAFDNLIEPVIRTIAENIPLIARTLIDTLDDHIAQQDTVKRQIAKAAKWSANIDETEVKEYLFRLVASQSFRQTLRDGLLILIAEFNQGQDKHRDQYQDKYQDKHQEKYTRQNKDENNDLSPINNHGLTSIDCGDFFAEIASHACFSFSLSSSILAILNCAENQNKLYQSLMKKSPYIVGWIKSQLLKPKVKSYIAHCFSMMIKRLNIGKIIQSKTEQFPPQKLEFMFRRLINEQLIFIELLGAILGALSGLALVNVNYFLIGIGFLASIWLVDTCVTQLLKKKQAT